ncbi:hypothetical protein ACOSP7_030343 [Xanthoceras sorbifolium]
MYYIVSVSDINISAHKTVTQHSSSTGEVKLFTSDSSGNSAVEDLCQTPSAHPSGTKSISNAIMHLEKIECHIGSILKKLRKHSPMQLSNFNIDMMWQKKS